MIIMALAGGMTLQVDAYDYRTDQSEGFKPNEETVDEDRALRAAKEVKNLELICTIDGVPGAQINIDTNPKDYEEESVRGGMSHTNNVEVIVTKSAYINRIFTFAVSDNSSRAFSQTETVNRMTGAYEKSVYSGSGARYISVATNPNHPAWQKSIGTCEPGKHVTEAQF